MSNALTAGARITANQLAGPTTAPRILDHHLERLNSLGNTLGPAQENLRAFATRVLGGGPVAVASETKPAARKSHADELTATMDALMDLATEILALTRELERIA